MSREANTGICASWPVDAVQTPPAREARSSLPSPEVSQMLTFTAKKSRRINLLVAA